MKALELSMGGRFRRRESTTHTVMGSKTDFSLNIKTGSEQPSPLKESFAAGEILNDSAVIFGLLQSF